jgi:hypothetical protein
MGAGANVSELEGILAITRATSKFAAIYDGQTEKMNAFSKWAKSRLEADND